jgi:tetratricopeptide (TPR) repeat protein
MSKEFKKYLGAGDQYAEKGEWEKALEAYEKVLEETPYDKTIHERIIRIYLAKRDRKGYLEAVNRFKQLKENPQNVVPPLLSSKEPQRPIKSTDAGGDLLFNVEEKKEPPKVFKAFEPPSYRPAQSETTKKEVALPEASLPKGEPKPLSPPELPKPFSPPEPLRKEPPAKSISEPSLIKPVEPGKPSIEMPREKPSQPVHPQAQQKQIPEPVKSTTSHEQAVEQEKKASVNEADVAEADARQLERQGKKDLAIKAYLHAAKLWEQKGNKERAGGVYEKAFELSGGSEGSFQILNKLNELYGQGVKLKQATVMEIYRRIYHMKV